MDYKESEHKAVDDFAVDMKAKLDKHRPNQEGDSFLRGVNLDYIEDCLEAARDDEDWISVANYAMMLNMYQNN